MSTILDANYLMDKLGVNFPLIGVYDAPHDTFFETVIEPVSYRNTCMFAYFNAWMRGQTLKITSLNFGCKGAGYWLFGKEGRSRNEFVEFLVGEEGLKCSKVVMDKWLDNVKPYHSDHKCIFIGPLKNEWQEYLKSVTFFVNPDQLSALLIGANYCSSSKEDSPVQITFGSGCMQILTLVPPNKKPVALIGATDLAMRKYLPKDILAFTVNPLMLETLCKLNGESFLNKPFLSDLKMFRKNEKGGDV